MRLPTSDSMMKMPAKPPDFKDLLEKAARSHEDLFALFSVPLDDQRYHHWDSLVHRKPPKDMSREHWWLGLKLRRRNLFKPIALVDSQGKAFQYAMTDTISEAQHRVDLRAGGRIEGPTSITNPETKDRYYISSLIQEAITSSQLEGATTTRLVAKEMLKTGREPRDRNERMIVNNFEAMKRISEIKNQDLTPELVFQLHEIVTNKTLNEPSAAGRLRKASESVVVSDDFGTVYHRPPPAKVLPERLERMCRFANGENSGTFVHPVVRAIILHFWLAYDHPFVDGNGRTARTLFYWSMMRSGYWLCEFISISQIILNAPKKYYLAFLHTETDDNDLTYFIHYHLGVLDRAVTELHRYIEKKSREVKELELRAKALDCLNHRQTALLSHAMRKPGHRYTVKSHQRSHGVAYQTARSDLLQLSELGLLTYTKSGKAFVFRAVPDLEKALITLTA